LEDSLIIINNYNRDNGNLVWGKNINISKSLSSFPMVPPVCSSGTVCDFCADFTTYLEPYSDDTLLLVLHDEIIKMAAIQSQSRAVRQKDVHLQIAKTHEKNRQLDRAIEEYKSLIKTDQMNQEAYWDLANIYQKKKDDAKAVKSLISYSELVLPTSTAGIKTIQKLKKLSGLKWEKNIYWNGFNQSEMRIDNERLFLFLDNNVESYSIHSSALIWKSSFGDKNTRVVSTDVKSEKDIFFIKKHAPDVNPFYLKDRLSGNRIDFEAFKKASKYSLVAMNKRDGDKLWDIPLDITGESDVVWMGAISNTIIIQSIFQNNMSVSAYDILGKHFLWETSFDISPLYTTYDLTPAFYNGYLLVPLDNRIEYINAENGSRSETYTNEDIDQIFFFNENSIQDNTMKIFVDDYVYEYEYIVVDLDNNLKIAGGFLNLENPERGMWINNIFVDVSSSGIVIAYDTPLAGENDPAILWRENYNASLDLLEVDKQNIYLLNKDDNYIYEVSTLSGKEIKKTRLLWPGDSVEIRGHYFIVQSKNKLYVFPI
jgi:outer membrane protein assembly factor BamB